MLCKRLTPVLGIALLAAGPAAGQVTVDLHALQALPERGSPTPVPRRIAPPRPAPTGDARAAVPPPTAGVERPAPPTPPAAQPALPENVPSVASIPAVPPPVETAPPPPPAISEAAPTKAEPDSKGMRILFGAGSSDLSPDSAAALKQLAAAAPQADSTYNVAAFAAGNRDDPSTARRLSLARAMAVRSALVNDGVPSNRIYVRALGDAYGSGPADRVDVAVAGAGGSSTAQMAPK